MSAASLLQQLLLIGFAGCLGAAAWYDCRARRVPNRLVLLVLGTALVASVLRTGDPLLGPWGALVSATLGLLCWLPWWLLGMLGAGDVKFFAASAAWIGPALTWRATVLAALLGGVLSVVMAFRSARVATRMPIPPASDPHAPMAPRTVPYAVPMAMALAAAMWQPQLLYLW